MRKPYVCCDTCVYGCGTDIDDQPCCSCVDGMNYEMQLVWYRFKTASVDDYRPITDMKEIGMPWWCTGCSADGSHVIIVCYLPEGEALSKYWEDAYDIDMEYRNEIKYSERFPKPKWLENSDMNEVRKVCPLKLIGGNNSYAQDPYCEKEKCAWWLNFENGCAIPTIAGVLSDSTIRQTNYQSGRSVYGN